MLYWGEISCTSELKEQLEGKKWLAALLQPFRPHFSDRPPRPASCTDLVRFRWPASCALTWFSFVDPLLAHRPGSVSLTRFLRTDLVQFRRPASCALTWFSFVDPLLAHWPGSVSLTRFLRTDLVQFRWPASCAPTWFSFVDPLLAHRPGSVSLTRFLRTDLVQFLPDVQDRAELRHPDVLVELRLLHAATLQHLQLTNHVAADDSLRRPFDVLRQPEVARFVDVREALDGLHVILARHTHNRPHSQWGVVKTRRVSGDVVQFTQKSVFYWFLSLISVYGQDVNLWRIYRFLDRWL